jgi:hypothetical protein
MRGTELYGLCTDKSRRMLFACGWEYDGLLFKDPSSQRWFAEPEATAIMYKRISGRVYPERGIEGYMKQRSQYGTR